MSNIKYFLRTISMNYIAVPILTSIIFFAAVAFGAIDFVGVDLSVLIMVAILSVVNAICSFFIFKRILRNTLSDKFLLRYMPVLVPLAIQLIVWTVCMIISGGFYGNNIFSALQIVELPFLPFFIIMSLLGKLLIMYYVPLIFNITSLIIFTILERKTKTRVKISKKIVSGFISIVLICSITCGIITIKRSENILPPTYGFDYGNGYSSVDIYRYDVKNADNILPILSEPSTFIIEDEEDMLVLDGAEAAYPVYSAFANACYDNISKIDMDKKDLSLISFTNTIYAFENLVKGDVDIFFGAAPSKAQEELVTKAGKKLVLTPIAKEAFVFFASYDNPVENITTELIKNIYSGKTKNWNEITNKNEKIVAYQRPENSGSQTILQKIMGDTPIQKPLKEEYISGMGGVSEKVAAYRDGSGALGYSFRFFTTGMIDNSDKIKLLSINGVAPTAENIADKSYPFTVNLYAITLEDNKKENIKPFLDWMVEEQGQELIEKVGYIKN